MKLVLSVYDDLPKLEQKDFFFGVLNSNVILFYFIF